MWVFNFENKTMMMIKGIQIFEILKLLNIRKLITLLTASCSEALADFYKKISFDLPFLNASGAFLGEINEDFKLLDPSSFLAFRKILLA